MEKDKIENSLIDSIDSDKLVDIGSDLAEVGLDTLLQDGVLKDIPFVGIAFKTLSFGINIKERIFTKKVLAFLYQLNKIKSEDREKFVQEMNKKPGFKTEVAEKVLDTLDRADDMEKAKIIGNLFGIYVKKIIDKSTFERVSASVNKAFVEDLRRIKIKPSFKDLPPEVKSNLYSAGLGTMVTESNTEYVIPGNEGGSGGYVDVPHISFSENESYKTLIRYGFD